MERICLRSFSAVGYEVHLYCYELISNVPQGVVTKDADAILPRHAIFRDDTGGYASFADQFRLHLLERKGGWWFDTDFLAVRLLPEPSDLRFASTWEPEFGQCAINSAIWCKPGDPHVAELRRRCDEVAKEGMGFGGGGPHLLNPYIAEHSLQKNVAKWWEFCPYQWRSTHRMAFHSTREYLKDRIRLAKHFVYQFAGTNYRASYVRPSTRAIHWHSELWRWANMDKNVLYHPLSPYGRAQRSYRD